MNKQFMISKLHVAIYNLDASKENSEFREAQEREALKCVEQVASLMKEGGVRLKN